MSMQKIRSITFGLDETSSFEVGHDGITEIAPINKNGSMADIPWVSVRKGDVVHSEHCQHNLTGIYYFPPDNA